MRSPRLLGLFAAVALAVGCWASLTLGFFAPKPVSGEDIDPAFPPNRQALEKFQTRQVVAFGQSLGFGPPRVEQPSMWEPALLSLPLQPNGRDPVSFRRAQFQLVSLLLHSPAVAYPSRPPIGSGRHESYAIKNAAPPANRSLDAFELAALSRLQAGEGLVVGLENRELRVLGALRAEVSCLECHEKTSQGALLGAFSYRLIPSGAN